MEADKGIQPKKMRKGEAIAAAKKGMEADKGIH
jgi:hypothetical protein